MRCFRRSPPTARVCRAGTATGHQDLAALRRHRTEAAALLEGIIRRGWLSDLRRNGSGQDHAAGALGAVAAGERIVCGGRGRTRTAHPHLVKLVARCANVEGVGEVTVRDLVKQALRMRPDRIVVGEVRGAEVVDLLAALDTGHDGGAGTVHANNAAEVPARLEALGGLGRTRPRGVCTVNSQPPSRSCCTSAETERAPAGDEIGVLERGKTAASAPRPRGMSTPDPAGRERLMT